MGSVPMRITRITENLRVIQTEISILAGQELGRTGGECLAAPDIHALRRVKSSVDHLRQVLRTYIDFASAHLGPDSEEFQRARTERTTHILQFACEGLQRLEGKDHEVPSSIFEQLTQMAIAAVDRHQPRRVELEPEEMLQAVAD